ncbi:hypothetical protein [Streptomyces poriticola]|uniref:hypothetical protein n=1 Tax=Streptomyces poriticola TaxID=3120506 RepID=UPI002FCE403B
MAWVVGAGMLLSALAVTVGIITLRTGWIPPLARGHVRRPKLYGLGVLAMGLSPLLPGLFYFDVLPGASWDLRFFGMNAFVLVGLLLIAASQLMPVRRPSPTHEVLGDAASPDRG